MTPTPYPTIDIPYEQIADMVMAGFQDAMNDPVLPFVLAAFIGAGVLALITGSIRYVLKSARR